MLNYFLIVRTSFTFWIILNLGSALQAAALSMPRNPCDPLRSIISDDYTNAGALNPRKLPAKISLHPKSAELKSMSAYANRTFAKENKIESLVTFVNRVAEGEVPTEADVAVLNGSYGRAIGNLSRDRALAFDQAHLAVPRLAKFKKAIRSAADPREVVTAAQDLRKVFNELPVESELRKIASNHLDAHDDSVRNLLYEVRRLMTPETLTEAQHQELGTLLRRFATYYQAKNAIAPSKEGAATLAYLKALVSRMGVTHDEAVMSALSKSVENKPLQRPLEFPDRKRIRDFVERVELEQMDRL